MFRTLNDQELLKRAALATLVTRCWRRGGRTSVWFHAIALNLELITLQSSLRSGEEEDFVNRFAGKCETSSGASLPEEVRVWLRECIVNAQPSGS